MTDGWVVIPNWDKFQHYKDRDPVWIKLYLELNSRDDWRRLTFGQRGLLVSVWIEYGRADTRLRSRDLWGRVGQPDRHGNLEALIHAGFLQVSASPRALARDRGREETPPTPPSREGGIKPPSKKQLQKLTGCRWVRGSHGGRHIPDPLGTDPPPKDWPYGRPSRREVELAMEAEL